MNTYLPTAVKTKDGYLDAPARVTASLTLGAVVVRKVSAPQVVSEKSGAYVDPGDSFVLGFVSNGEVKPSYGRTSSMVKVGQVAMNDMSRVSSFQISPDYRSMSVRVDKSDLTLTSTEIETLTRWIVPYNEGTPLIMCAIAAQLMKVGKPLEPVAAGIVARTLIDLASAFSAESLGRLIDPDTVRRNVVVEAKLHIDAHLSDPLLNPATIAESMGISLRSLHLAFENEEASVARTILARRLERCRIALEDPLQRHFSIDTIASAWGFLHPSHFSRAFRSAFGYSPRDWRARSMERQIPVDPRK